MKVAVEKARTLLVQAWAFSRILIEVGKSNPSSETFSQQAEQAPATSHCNKQRVSLPSAHHEHIVGQRDVTPSAPRQTPIRHRSIAGPGHLKPSARPEGDGIRLQPTHRHAALQLLINRSVVRGIDQSTFNLRRLFIAHTLRAAHLHQRRC